jgi:hypothetical protein
MRKIAAIIIASLYLFLSTGLVINVHYCHDKVKSLSVFAEAEKCCSELCEMENNCCHDRQFIIQLEPQDKMISAIADLSISFIFLWSTKIHFEVPKIAEPQTNNFTFHLPPPKNEIWKKNCSFLFYG